MLFVFHTTCSGEECCYSISNELIDTVNWSQPLPLHSHFRSYRTFQFLLGEGKIQPVCVHFQLFELVHITASGEEVVVQLQHSQFSVLKNEELDNDWFFVFNLFFGEFKFIQWFVHKKSFLNSLILMAACVFCLWGTSLQCVGSGPWSRKRTSFWLEVSWFLWRHLSLHFSHFAFLRPLLTAQNCCSTFLECTPQNGVFVCKQDAIVDITTAAE